ncbi:MAG: hypothetical protein ACLQFR_08670 [Streptosporangiaceae bacterium]
MTSAAQPAPHTALAVLFGSDGDAADALARLASDPASLGRVLAGLPEATREAAAREVTAAASGLLNVDLIDMLVAGWRKYQDLVAAAKRTLAAPGSVELVQIVSHRVTVAQQPYVNVLLDDRRVATLNVGLSVVFDVSALLAKISAGLLVAVESGRCDITATLSVEDADVLTKEAHFELPGIAALGRGIRLLPADEYPHTAESPQAANDDVGASAQLRQRSASPLLDR